MDTRVVLGMSGGFDSSLSAQLLQAEGFDVIGLTLITQKHPQHADDAIARAQQVANTLQIAHYTEAAHQDFAHNVIAPFVASYEAGSTPNPCITCNMHFKFPQLVRFADTLGAPYIATGHYARVVDTPQGKRIARGKDRTKDQSYFLSRLPQDVIERLLLPLANETKTDLKNKRGKIQASFKNVSDSQDVCFLEGTTLSSFLSEQTNAPRATLQDEDGNVLALGLPAYFYTIGQRKGLGLGGGPWFVAEIDTEHNKVVVAKEKPRQTSFYVKDLSFDAFAQAPELSQAEVQIRYRSKPKVARYTTIDNTCVLVELDLDEGDAIAKGQTAAFYTDDICLGGGVIAYEHA